MSKEIIILSKPISAHGQDYTELELREPTVDDVIEIGYPYLVLMRDGQDTGIELRPKVVVHYVSKLAGIPLSSARKISLSDLTKAQQVVMSFFGEEIAAQSNS